MSKPEPANVKTRQISCPREIGVKLSSTQAVRILDSCGRKTPCFTQKLIINQPQFSRRSWGQVFVYCCGRRQDGNRRNGNASAQWLRSARAQNTECSSSHQLARVTLTAQLRYCSSARLRLTCSCKNRLRIVFWKITFKNSGLGKIWGLESQLCNLTDELIDLKLWEKS